jgi:hypothetical protein
MSGTKKTVPVVEVIRFRSCEEGIADQFVTSNCPFCGEPHFFDAIEGPRALLCKPARGSPPFSQTYRNL